MRDDIVSLLHTLYNLLSTKQMLLKKFEVNLQTIQLNLINEHEEAIVTILSANNVIIEDISACNYSIAQCTNKITSKLGIEYSEFNEFIKRIDNPLTHTISDILQNIDFTIKHIYNLNQTIIILLSNRQESIIKNINEINKILQLQTHIAF